MLKSDANGNATWVNPPPTNDNDWSFGTGDNIFRLNGNVGIGTNTYLGSQKLSIKSEDVTGLHVRTFQDNPWGFGIISEVSNVNTKAIAVTNGTNNFIVYGDGRTQIGNTGIQSGYMLSVAGKVKATEIMVAELADWSDYVFLDDYILPKLHEVESFINTNKHLPDIPSETEVKEEGINLGEMDALLLKKIEELTLYTIEQQKILEKQQEEIERLKEELSK